MKGIFTRLRIVPEDHLAVKDCLTALGSYEHINSPSQESDFT